MNTNPFFSTALIAFVALKGFDLAAQTPNKFHSKDAVATVAGRPLYEEDLSPSAQGQLTQLAIKQHEQRTKALGRLIEQHLLEIEARKMNVSVETLLAQNVDATVPEPTTAEVQAYYFGLKERLNRPFEDIRSDLSSMLKQARVQEARQNYLAELSERNQVRLLLRPPRVEVSVDAERLRGDPSAPVTIVEFSDFQCSYCQKNEQALRNVLAKYKGKVNFSYRDFPLKDVHPQAQLAAEASRCAGEQGKFWEFHDLLFEEPSKLERDSLLERAKKLKLDESRFSSCLNTGQYKHQIELDIQDGTRAGVSATPGFFINGIFLGGAQPVTTFEKIVDEELSSGDRKSRPQ